MPASSVRIADRIVNARYAAIRTADAQPLSRNGRADTDNRRTEIERMAREPIGPERVTSRPFSRCPAAQMRSISPAAAIAPPIATERDVGLASHRTTDSADESERDPPPRKHLDQRRSGMCAEHGETSDRRGPSLLAGKYRAGTSRQCGTAADSGRHTHGIVRP